LRVPKQGFSASFFKYFSVHTQNTTVVFMLVY
jgi:hypothetical protein